MAEGPSHLQELIDVIMKDNELSMHSFNWIISNFLNWKEYIYSFPIEVRQTKIISNFKTYISRKLWIWIQQNELSSPYPIALMDSGMRVYNLMCSALVRTI